MQITRICSHSQTAAKRTHHDGDFGTASTVRTTAVLEGDHYVLNGEKIFITNADEADTYVIFAVTTPGSCCSMM